MENAPLLSVIVPFYNSEKYIIRCLESICCQSYKNLEIICVNDGSIDSSRNLVLEIAQNDYRLTIIDKENGGQTSARKMGLNFAQGKYITFVDSDDWIARDMYENLMELLISSNADLICSSEIREYSSYSTSKIPFYPDGLYENDDLVHLKETVIDINSFYRCNVSGHLWDKIFKKDPLIKILSEVPEEIHINEDAAIVYPYIYEAKKIYLTNNSYYHYCIRSDSVMGTKKDNDFQSVNCLVNFVKRKFHKYIDDVNNVDLQARNLCEYTKMFRNLENTMSYKNGLLYMFGKIDKKEKILLYGSGKFGVELHSFLIRKGWFENITWVDSDGKNGAKKVSEIKLQNVDKVIVAALLFEAVNDITECLLNLGIEKKKILVADLKYIC